MPPEADGASRGVADEHRRSITFSGVARQAADALGTGWAFMAACALVLAWAVTGPIFHFSDGWQLVINTGTTIATFLMVFLIQNTQNRDARALHLKLDELIRSKHDARNRLIDLENSTDQEMDTLKRDFEVLRNGAADTSLALSEQGDTQAAAEPSAALTARR
jgi:low affinity Fe/Cu permease